MHPVKDGVHICDLNSCLRLQSMELRELLSWYFDNKQYTQRDVVPFLKGITFNSIPDKNFVIHKSHNAILIIFPLNTYYDDHAN